MNAFNFTTNIEYAGRNASLVGNGKYPAFATFNQIQSAGYKINKGAKGVHILCGYRPKEVTENGETKVITVPKHAIVFDIADTNALDDKDLVKFLKNGKRISSELEANTKILEKVLVVGVK